MATTTKTWAFAANDEGWIGQGASSGGMSWSSSHGGCLDLAIYPGRGYVLISGNWEAFGVPPGATVTHARLDASERAVASSGTSVVGPWTLLDASGTVSSMDGSADTPLGTLIAQRTTPGGGDASWQARSGTDIAVPSGSQASTSPVAVKLYCNSALSPAPSSHLVDAVALTITYTTVAGPSGGGTGTLKKSAAGSGVVGRVGGAPSPRAVGRLAAGQGTVSPPVEGAGSGRVVRVASGTGRVSTPASRSCGLSCWSSDDDGGRAVATLAARAASGGDSAVNLAAHGANPPGVVRIAARGTDRDQGLGTATLAATAMGGDARSLGLASGGGPPRPDSSVVGLAALAGDDRAFASVGIAAYGGPASASLLLAAAGPDSTGGGGILNLAGSGGGEGGSASVGLSAWSRPVQSGAVPLFGLGDPGRGVPASASLGIAGSAQPSGVVALVGWNAEASATVGLACVGVPWEGASVGLASPPPGGVIQASVSLAAAGVAAQEEDASVGLAAPGDPGPPAVVAIACRGWGG